MLAPYLILNAGSAVKIVERVLPQGVNGQNRGISRMLRR